MIMFLAFMLAMNDKTIEIRTLTGPAPQIDGAIEDVWLQADSACDFVQFVPYEKTDPTERTVVYMLQDDNNLYVAFKCHAEKNPPVACLTRDEDYVAVSLDPYGAQTTGYFFLIYASELYWDGWILDGGTHQDLTWEGIWYHDVKMYPDRLEFEMRIPFKTIRYNKDLSEWGVQFLRHIAVTNENDLWTETSQSTGDLMTNWGTMKNISPKSSGYYFEFFPEGFVRYDKYENDSGGYDIKIKPRPSFNFKWDITPQTTINATTFPDFAQIESDPFTLNLSRYPTYLREQRPFFIEGTDIFRLSSLENGPFTPLEIFYTRRIGKLADGDAVPIIGGIKLTALSSKWSSGLLGAYTGEYTNAVYGLDEPARWFGVLRTKYQLMPSSDMGILLSSSFVDTANYNYALGVDATYRNGPNQILVQGAVSDYCSKKGWAVTSAYSGRLGMFSTNVAVDAISDSFDVRDIGFVPWVGQKRILAMCGPQFNFRQGSVRTTAVQPGLFLLKSPGSADWSRGAILANNIGFRNMWGLYWELDVADSYESDTNFFYRSASLNFWGFLKGNNINGGSYYEYTMNYARGFLAYQGSNWLTASYSIMPPWSITMTVNTWLEWDPDNHLVALWPMIRPRTDIRLSPTMTLTIMDQIVMYMPEASFDSLEYTNNRLGLIFSWNFSPKSWFYIAVNDYRSEDIDQSLALRYQIAAVKVKYLIYF
jgi:hypothetical protein